MEISGIFFIVLLHLFILLLIILLRHGLQYRLNRLIITIWASLIFTILTIGYFNQTPLFFNREALSTSLTNPFLSSEAKDSLIFAENPFILIDVSTQQQLLGSGIEGDSITRRAAVDRKRLGEFLNWLAGRKDAFGQVICDVIFQQKSSADSFLLNAVNEFRNTQKLLIAGTSLYPDYSISKDSVFDTEKFESYPVDITKYNDTYFSQKLYYTEKEYQSPTGLQKEFLVYKLYLLRKNYRTSEPLSGAGMQLIKESSISEFNRHSHWATNWFIPKLSLTEEDISGSAYRENQTFFDQLFSLLFSPISESRFKSINFVISPLAEVISDDGKARLEERFSNYKGVNPIILIASFSDPQNDVHLTAAGKMHGGLIFMNIFYNLLAERHIISIGYCVYLLLFYCAIFTVMIELQAGFHRQSKLYYKQQQLRSFIDSRKLGDRSDRMLSLLLDWFDKLVLKQLHYWMLIGMVIGADRLFEHSINIAFPLLFLGLSAGWLSTLEKLLPQPLREN